MTTSDFPVPPLKSVQAALRTSTEFLARELTSPTSEPPAWSAFEWRIARAVVALHGVSALLAGTLRWQGPESWQRFLSDQRDHSVSRAQFISQLLSRIELQARRAGIGMVALKGAALNEIGLYETGERPMGDVDLLVRAEDMEATARVLAACDYAEWFTSRRHKIFEPRVTKATTWFGEHIDNSIKIEVHTRIAEPLPIVETDITRHVLPHPAHAGLNQYPSLASLMLHLLLHAAGNIRARALRLIQLHDIALLAARMGAGDWAELLEAGRADCGLWWALAPFALVARYYPAAIPPSVVASLEPGCPWLLGKLARRHQLADVSWSNARIQAFPGIEWSRSAREALNFAVSRVWPSRVALVELQAATDNQPLASMIPWYGISHGARIVRWIFSKPPRVQTLLAVRSALGYEP
jgi:Uncharacterised nucleotidyltransferase